MRDCEGVSRDRDPKALPDGVSAATRLGGGDLAGGSVSLRLTLELCRVLLSSCKLLCSLPPGLQRLGFQARLGCVNWPYGSMSKNNPSSARWLLSGVL